MNDKSINAQICLHTCTNITNTSIILMWQTNVSSIGVKEEGMVSYEDRHLIPHMPTVGVYIYLHLP